MLDESRLDELSRLAVGVTTRRLALGVAAAAGGLALAGNTDAKKNDVDAARRRRGRRGKRGKKGPNGPNGPSGPTGPNGPPAGASVIVEREVCTFPDVGAAGATDGCEASCPDGYVAVGGGYDSPSVVDNLGHVMATRPVLNGDDLPVGWVTDVEYLRILGFEVTTYVICVPE